MNRIYLVGFMGAGKSTVGKKLSSLLDYQFLDLDDDFEESYKISIHSFFKKYDETLFRKLEYQKLLSSLSRKNTVISTGGGTPCFFDSMDVMNANGITVYLKMSPEAIASRLKIAKKKRPLVESTSDEELLEFIKNKLEARKGFYEKAKITINAINLDVKQLSEQIQKEIAACN
jgi:shikimate kinase